MGVAMKLVLAIAVLLALTWEARAGFMDGNQLYEYCTSTDITDTHFAKDISLV